jgi:HK97 family phage prohead protease
MKRLFTFTGLAVAYNVLTKPGFIFETGAFRCLDETVPLLFDHQQEFELGAAHLHSISFPAGIKCKAECVLDDAKPSHMKILELLRHSEIRGFSVGFSRLKWEREAAGTGRIIHVQRALLNEVSICQHQGNPLCTISGINSRSLTMSDVLQGVA